MRKSRLNALRNLVLFVLVTGATVGTVMVCLPNRLAAYRSEVRLVPVGPRGVLRIESSVLSPAFLQEVAERLRAGTAQELAKNDRVRRRRVRAPSASELRKHLQVRCKDGAVHIGITARDRHTAEAVLKTVVDTYRQSIETEGAPAQGSDRVKQELTPTGTVTTAAGSAPDQRITAAVNDLFEEKRKRLAVARDLSDTELAAMTGKGGAFAADPRFHRVKALYLESVEARLDELLAAREAFEADLRRNAELRRLEESLPASREGTAGRSVEIAVSGPTTSRLAVQKAVRNGAMLVSLVVGMLLSAALCSTIQGEGTQGAAPNGERSRAKTRQRRRLLPRRRSAAAATPSQPPVVKRPASVRSLSCFVRRRSAARVPARSSWHVPDPAGASPARRLTIGALGRSPL